MTRIAKHLLLQDLEGDAVLFDESSGVEIVIPHDALDPLADAARYFYVVSEMQHHTLADLLGEWRVDTAEGSDQ